jgi:hypothetical protein
LPKKIGRKKRCLSEIRRTTNDNATYAFPKKGKSLICAMS